MEGVLQQIPGHRKWASDFMAYMNCLQFDIIDPVENLSQLGLGNLEQVIQNPMLMRISRKIDKRLAEEIEFMQQSASASLSLMKRI